jgi:Ca2+-binding EF-hand superfamily protein
MNEMRMELVERIFIILDQDNDGVIDFNEVKH